MAIETSLKFEKRGVEISLTPVPNGISLLKFFEKRKGVRITVCDDYPMTAEFLYDIVTHVFQKMSEDICQFALYKNMCFWRSYTELEFYKEIAKWYF